MSTKWFTLDELAKRIDPSYEVGPDPALFGYPKDIHPMLGPELRKEKRKSRSKKAKRR